jgi:hypothetical protein
MYFDLLPLLPPSKELFAIDCTSAVLCFVDEVGSQGVGFHITDHIERLILLDGKLLNRSDKYGRSHVAVGIGCE